MRSACFVYFSSCERCSPQNIFSKCEYSGGYDLGDVRNKRIPDLREIEMAWHTSLLNRLFPFSY